jgi:hypothetical protein
MLAVTAAAEDATWCVCVCVCTHTHNIALTAAAEDATGHCLQLSEGEGEGGVEKGKKKIPGVSLGFRV